MSRVAEAAYAAIGWVQDTVRSFPVSPRPGQRELDPSKRLTGSGCPSRDKGSVSPRRSSSVSLVVPNTRPAGRGADAPLVAQSESTQGASEDADGRQTGSGAAAESAYFFVESGTSFSIRVRAGLKEY
jgi:hypothetical protein